MVTPGDRVRTSFFPPFFRPALHWSSRTPNPIRYRRQADNKLGLLTVAARRIARSCSFVSLVPWVARGGPEGGIPADQGTDSYVIFHRSYQVEVKVITGSGEFWSPWNPRVF